MIRLWFFYLSYFPIGLSNKTEIVKGGIIDFSIKTNYGYTRIDDLEKTDENFEYKIYTKKSFTYFCKLYIHIFQYDRKRLYV